MLSDLSKSKVLLSDLSKSKVLLSDLSKSKVLLSDLSKSKVLLSDLSRSRGIRMIWGFGTRFAQEVFDYVQSSEKNESTNKLLALMSISSDW